jgi:hypothetical protein
MRSHPASAAPVRLLRRNDAPTADAPAVPSAREQVTGTTVRNDIDTLVQNGKKRANETDVLQLIEQWEHGDVKSVGRVAIAINAALQRYPKQLAAGRDRLKDFAQGRGGAGVLPEPRLERANRDTKKADDFAWYENIPGHLFIEHASLVDFSPPNQAQGDEGDCFDLAVIAGMRPSDLRDMMRDEAPLSEILKFAKTHEVVESDLLKAQMERVKKDGAEEPKLFLVRYFVADKKSPTGSRPVWVPVDHEFPVGVDHKLKFATTKNGSLWLPVMEKAHAILKKYWSRIDGGSSADAMFDHFGIKGRDSTIATDFKDDDAGLYAMISKALDENRVVTSGTFDGPEKSAKKGRLGRGLMPKAPAPGPHVDHPMPSGIIPSHEYTVVGVITTRDPTTGEVERWVKLRNPWGDSVPDADPNAPAIDQKANPGVFYMKFSGYRQAFEDITVQQFKTDKPAPKKSKKS